MKAYKLEPGFDWHPFQGIPRNEPCPCGSGKKFKKCHLPLTARTIEKGKDLQLAKNIRKTFK